MLQKIIIGMLLAAALSGAGAHVVLENKSGVAGTAYKAVLQVGHGCQGSPTTGMAVQLPTGFQGAKPIPKAGWTLATQSAALDQPDESHGKRITQDVTQVSWTANGKENALADAHFDEFVVRGKLPANAGPIWFKAVQTCESGTNRWVEVPASGTSTAGLAFPAALLQVVPADDAPRAAASANLAPPVAKSEALVQVQDAWARASVPGQTSTGAFMKITATKALRLVGVSSPVAKLAQLHSMHMQGDVMRMHAVPQIDLPAGQAVELKSGGYHVMLLDLKRALPQGSTIALTLTLKDAQGRTSKQTLQVPVALKPAATAAEGHAH